MQQLKEKFFPTFQAAHGPNCTAVVLVDNSQGHSAYADDALRASEMNLSPGGKNKPLMHNSWYMNGGEHVSQLMVFPADHPTHANLPRGLKSVLEERGLFYKGLIGRCKTCTPDATDCCATRIMSLQPNFLEQKSLVEEVIEAAGMLSTLLLSHICQLNLLIRAYLHLSAKISL